MYNFELIPGAFVRLESQPDWGLGQVQSLIGNKATVNFKHRGKVVLNADEVSLVVVDP